MNRGFWEDGAFETEQPRPAQPDEAPSVEERSALLRAWASHTRSQLPLEGLPSVVHAHLAYPDRFGAALVASAGRPLIASFQLLPEATRGWSPDEYFGWRSDNLLSRLGRRLSRVIFVASSDDDVSRLRGVLGSRAVIERIPNCATLPRLHGDEQMPYPWKHGRVRLLSVGRLVSQKGFDRMVNALAHPSLSSIPWQWVIAGAGPDAQSLRSQIASRGLSESIAIEPDLRAAGLYPDADVVLCPSRSEGFPLVPLEAIEAGVLVVVSSIPPHHELLTKVPSAILSSDEQQWPRALGQWLTDADARIAARRAQREALPHDLRAHTGDQYAALYLRTSRTRTFVDVSL